MKKICQITTVIPPAKDGVGAAAIKIHKLLCKNGIESMIITSKNQKEGENIFCLVEKWSSIKLLKIIRKIYKESWKTIILHYPSPYIVNKHLFPLLSPISFLFGIPLSVYLHEFSIYTLIGKIKIYLLILFAKNVITTDSKNFIELQKLPFIKNKLYKLPTGSNFDIDFNFPIIEKSNKSKDKILIAYWGYIMRGKGILNFLDFVKMFKDDRVNFLFIGDIPENASDYDYELKEKVCSSPNLKFLGYLVDYELINTLRQIEILILPFEDGLTERRGSFMLAMQLGKTVITTKPKYQIPDLFNYYNIIFYEKIDELPKIVNNLINNKELLNKISSNAFKWYNEFYSNEKFLQKLLNIFS